MPEEQRKGSDNSPILLKIEKGKEQYEFFSFSVECYSILLHDYDRDLPDSIIDLMKELPLTNFLILTNHFFPSHVDAQASNSASLTLIQTTSLVSVVAAVSNILLRDEGDILRSAIEQRSSAITQDWDRIYLKKATEFIADVDTKYGHIEKMKQLLDKILKR